MSNYESIPKLLRAMSSSAMGTEGRDVIFNEAAKMIDESASIMAELIDIPGSTALDKVKKLKEWWLRDAAALDRDS